MFSFYLNSSHKPLWIKLKLLICSFFYSLEFDPIRANSQYIRASIMTHTIILKQYLNIPASGPFAHGISSYYKFHCVICPQMYSLCMKRGRCDWCSSWVKVYIPRSRPFLLYLLMFCNTLSFISFHEAWPMKCFFFLMLFILFIFPSFSFVCHICW